MKKLRIFLSVAAIVFAIGGTFASQNIPAFAIQGYEYIPASPGIPAECSVVSVDCNTFSANLCTINSHKVGNSSSISTQCGTQLKRP
jgi:hypothetical protein